MTRRPADLETLNSRLKSDSSLIEVAHHLGSVECWVVGGWIRDRALGREPPDLDLVVSGTEKAENAAALLGAAWGVIPRLLGRPEKAVWRLTGPTCKVEIWPMEEAGIEADVRRRDFTCNAMFWRLPNGPLFDPTGGLEDIAGRRIRAISRFNLMADPVRLLRGVRLQATLEGFSMESQTLGWISNLAPRLAESPRERVGAELLTLASAHSAGAGFRQAFSLGLLGPAGPRPSSTDSPFMASLDTLARLVGKKTHPAPSAVALTQNQAILAWLASGWSSSSPKTLARFAWPREITRTVAVAASNTDHARTYVNQNSADRREFIARCGDTFPTVLALAAAIDTCDGGHPLRWRRWWRQWIRSGRHILESKPLLDASDVAGVTGVEPGPRLGRILSDLNRATIRREVRSPTGARQWLQTYSEGVSSEPSSST